MQSIQKDTDLMGKRQNSEERRGNWEKHLKQIYQRNRANLLKQKQTPLGGGKTLRMFL
jgi:hypothetical protein